MPPKTLEVQLAQGTNQIVAITHDIHRSAMRGDYSDKTGTRHFANLLHHNIRQIDSLSQQLAAKVGGKRE